MRSTLDKLPGIRSDLVRLDDNPKKFIKTYMARQERTPQATCVYCNKEDHKGFVCEKVKDIKDGRKILSEEQLCFNCVKRVQKWKMLQL